MSAARAEQPPVPQQPVGGQQERGGIDLLGQRSEGWRGRRGQGVPTPPNGRPQIPLAPEHEAFREVFDPI